MNNKLTRRNFLSLVGAGTAAFGLAACGGSSDSTATDTTADDSAATTEGFTLVEDGKLTMISNFFFPPFVSMNAETGDFEGFDVDIYTAVCERIGLEPNILPSVQFDTIVPTIKQGGKADVSIGAVTITDERLEEIDFSDPYLDSNQAIVVKNDATATTAEDLNVEGTDIAVQSGTTGEAWVKENLPNATCKPLDDVIQCLTGVQSGLYAAVVCDLPVASYELKEAYSDLVIPEGGEIATGEQYGIVVSKDNPELTAAINSALAEIASDGTQDEIETKWFGSAI